MVDHARVGRDEHLELTRRQLFKGALGGAVAVGASMALAGSAKASDDPSTVAGIVDRADSERLTLRRPDGTTATILLSATGAVWRDQPIELKNLKKGEEVNAEGSWDGQAFMAEFISPTYRPGQATVTETDERGLETDKGWVAFNEFTQPHGGPHLEARPLSEIQAGDEVQVLGRFSKEEFIALRVGVVDN